MDLASLRNDVLAGLRSVMPIDAAFVATVDPATLLFTSVIAEEPLAAATQLFPANEYGRGDVNKFTTLAAAGEHVRSLDEATAGDRRESSRYVEVMAPLQLGDELRAALVSGGRCWRVLCLHRMDVPSGFSAEEVALVRRLAPQPQARRSDVAFVACGGDGREHGRRKRSRAQSWAPRRAATSSRRLATPTLSNTAWRCSCTV